MAVWMYKSNEGGKPEKVLIDPKRFQQHLNAGYVVDPEDLNPALEEADTNSTGLLSDSEVRAAAKVAGLKNVNNKKIETLKKELGYV